MPLPKKRYICSIVQNINGKFVGDVVVVTGHNYDHARRELQRLYHVPDVTVVKDYINSYDKEGIVSMRVAETNTYEEENPEFDNFGDDT